MATTITRFNWTDDPGTPAAPAGTGTRINNAQLQAIFAAVEQIFSGSGIYSQFVFGGTVKAEGFGSHEFIGGGVGGQQLVLQNTAPGSLNHTSLWLGNDAVSTGTQLAQTATGYAASGHVPGDGSMLAATRPGGLNLAATHASGVIRFFTPGLGGTPAVFINNDGSIYTEGPIRGRAGAVWYASPAGFQAQQFFNQAGTVEYSRWQWTGTTVDMFVGASVIHAMGFNPSNGFMDFGGSGIVRTRRVTVIGGGQSGAPTDAGTKAATLLLTDTGGNPGNGGSLEFGFGAGTYAQPYFGAAKGFGLNGANNTGGEIRFYIRKAITDAALSDAMHIHGGDGLVAIGVPDGTVGLPGLYFINDTNTGIQRVGTDEIDVVVGGLSGMTIWNNVGQAFARINGLLECLTIVPGSDSLGSLGLSNNAFGALYSYLNATTGSPANVRMNPADGQFQEVTSARRFKRDIRDLEVTVEDVLRLRPVLFKDRDDPNGGFVPGFIADEVAEVFPEAVSFDREGPRGLSYDRLCAYQQRVIQDLHRRVTALEAR